MRAPQWWVADAPRLPYTRNIPSTCIVYNNQRLVEELLDIVSMLSLAHTICVHKLQVLLKNSSVKKM
jgi:hypothetical protein